ncbi:hypothetical protein ACOSQ2_013440 [Xanthoceras sorbifolium]
MASSSAAIPPHGAASPSSPVGTATRRKNAALTCCYKKKNAAAGQEGRARADQSQQLSRCSKGDFPPSLLLQNTTQHYKSPKQSLVRECSSKKTKIESGEVKPDQSGISTLKSFDGKCILGMRHLSLPRKWRLVAMKHLRAISYVGCRMRVLIIRWAIRLLGAVLRNNSMRTIYTFNRTTPTRL